MLIELLLLKRVNDIKRDLEQADAESIGTALAIGFFALWALWIPAVFWWLTRLGIPKFLTIPGALIATGAFLLWSWPAYIFYGLIFTFIVGLIIVIGLGFIAARIDHD